MLSDAFSSHKLQLGLTAVASASLAATAVLALQRAKRQYAISDLKGSIPDLNTAHDIEQVCINTIPS